MDDTCNDFKLWLSDGSTRFVENLFALPGCSILHLMTVPLCLQFILLICWTFCGLYVFRCGAFALDRLLIIIIIIRKHNLRTFLFTKIHLISDLQA